MTTSNTYKDRAEYIEALREFYASAQRLLESFPEDGVANAYPACFDSFDDVVLQVFDWYATEQDKEA